MIMRHFLCKNLLRLIQVSLSFLCYRVGDAKPVNKIAAFDFVSAFQLLRVWLLLNSN